LYVRRAWLAAVAALIAVAACSPPAEQAGPRPSDSSTASPSPTGSDPTATAAALTEPLAFAFDIHRPALDLTTEQARAIVAGRPITWAALGQSGGSVRVRVGAGVDVPLEAVDAPGAALGADAREHAVTAASEIATSTVHRAVRMDTASAAAWLAAMLDARLAAMPARV
jgi:hypothetical protein